MGTSPLTTLPRLPAWVRSSCSVHTWPPILTCVVAIRVPTIIWLLMDGWALLGGLSCSIVRMGVLTSHHSASLCPWENSEILIWILYMRKLRHREVKWLAQGHTADKRQNASLCTQVCSPKACTFTSVLSVSGSLDHAPEPPGGLVKADRYPCSQSSRFSKCGVGDGAFPTSQ